MALGQSAGSTRRGDEVTMTDAGQGLGEGRSNVWKFNEATLMTNLLWLGPGWFSSMYKHHFLEGWVNMGWKGIT